MSLYYLTELIIYVLSWINKAKRCVERSELAADTSLQGRKTVDFIETISFALNLPTSDN